VSFPIQYPYPVGLENPVTVRAAAVLGAVGAWDAAPTEIPCAGVWWVRLYHTYTRAQPGGRFQYRYQVSPYAADLAGVEDWFNGSLYVPDQLVVAVDSTSNVQREQIEYWSTGAGAETFVSPPIHLAGCSERFRLQAREMGTVPPGTLHTVAVFYVGG
jgi:hypothetical protein